MELEQIKTELEQTVRDLTKAGEAMRVSAIAAVNTHSEYDLKKNQYLLVMNKDAEKRTVQIMTALYRTKYADERLNWQVAKSTYEVDLAVYKGLQAKLTALMSLLKIEKGQMDISRFQT